MMERFPLAAIGSVDYRVSFYPLMRQDTTNFVGTPGYTTYASIPWPNGAHGSWLMAF